MGFPDHLPTFAMSPSPFSSDSDAIDLRHQFPIDNEPLNPRLGFDQHPPFKRARNFDNGHSNGFSCPPRGNQQPQNPQSNKVTSHLFFKTCLCAKFRHGSCRNGENCNFAHGVEDMRQPPPNWREIVCLHGIEERPSPGNWDDDQKIIQKMKLCKKYYNGEECHYGEKCSFLHEYPSKFRDDLGRFRESSAITIGTNGSPKSYGEGSNNFEGKSRVVDAGSNISRGNIKSTYRKTKLCIQWDKTGNCPFREDCHFAHGEEELQVPGGRTEAESAGAVATLPKPLSVFANDATTSDAESVTPMDEDELAKNHLQRLKVNKKINTIYGDWIDDLPLVIPSEMEP